MSATPTMGDCITAARARWGKAATVRLTWIRESWVASAGHTTSEGAGAVYPHTGLGTSPAEAFATLHEALTGRSEEP